MASNTTQIPVEVKLQISNQAQVMRKLTNEFQDVFSNVDPGTAFGKKLAKAFSKIDNKLISAESLLGKDFFSESDMLRVTKYIESISEAMGEINTRAQSMSAKGLGLDTTEIEKAHQAVIDLQKTITEQKKAKVGSILAVDSKDFQELSAFSSKSGFSGGKNFANNISAMNVSVGKLRQEWAELTNAAKEAEQAQQNALKTKVQANLKVNAAQAELDKRANFNEDVAQQIAAVRLGGTKGRGIQQVISDYQQLLTEQLEGTDWKTGGFDFAQVIAGWLEVDPSELEGAATEVVQKLQFAIQEKLQKDALKKSNLLRSNAEAILSGQKDILSKDSGYTYRNQQAMEASIELQNASTAFDEANQNFLNIQTNAKNCEELLDKITAQIERLKELQKQYNDLVDEQNKEELDNARQREQQARRMAEGPTKEESQNIYRQTSENVKKTQQISAENIERNRIQKQHEMEQEALERETEQFTSNLKQSIRQWMSAQQVINLIKQGIRQAYQDIQGLDKAMTNIAVVTDMSVSDLWGKINEYMSIAQQYGVTTQGVYEVSQLYYQQGLGTDEVMAATTETLKMARIAGMEYAEAADAMTVAIRAFKMEMSEAAHVTDVYSKVAAVTASDTEELAIAMSKTASSAESVGSSFENTTAMLAVMIETTRESAQNLGSALKSIISRYGEMKTGLTVDSEGELIDYNKVDTALKSVGISLKDTQGQFRDFDEVIFELSSKWDTLDKNTQRYIATIMAGNRQQSRFIALVDNWERLDEVAKSAEDSEDAGLLQYSKTLDSLETKISNIKTSFQQFYMDIFNGPLIGKGLEFINNIIKGFNKLGKLSSILNISSIVGAVKVISTVFVSNFANSFKQISNAWKGTLREMSVETGKSAKEQGLKWYQGFTEKNNQGKTVLSKKGGKVATGAMMAGSILSMVGSSVASRNQTAGAWLSAGGNALSIGAQLAMINPVLGLVGGGIAGFVTLLTSLPSKMEKAQQDLEKATEKSNEANIRRAETKDKYNNLNEYLTKLENLEKTRYDSQENYDEWVEVNNQALEAFPELASTFDAANNAVVDLISAENNLTQARLDAQKAAKEAADAQIAAALAKNIVDQSKAQVVESEIENTYGNGTNWELFTLTQEEYNALSQEVLKKRQSGYDYSMGNLTHDRETDRGFLGLFGEETSYTFYSSNRALSSAAQYLDINAETLEWLGSLPLVTDSASLGEFYDVIQKTFDPKYLKNGKYKEDFWKEIIPDNYENVTEALGAYSSAERSSVLSQKALRNTVRAGIGTYLSSDFMWEDQDESFVGLANANKVFQEALYKDFETFLKTGNKKITEESWKEWVDNNYNGAYAKLQKDYENFYKTLSSEGQIEDYNAFEQGSATLTDIEYGERLKDFNAEDDLRKEMVRQFTEEYNKAETEFKEALGKVEFLDEGYITNLFDDDSTFNFRQEYSDEIMTQARQLEKYVEAGQMATEQAKEYFTNYINLWETLEVNKEQLKPDQLEQIRTILSQTDFTTPEGIVESFRQIGEIYTEAGLEIPENFSLNANNILNYINSSLVNLNTSYNTLADKVAENIDLISKQIDKASNGFDNIKDLTEFGDKYGLTADDFTFDALTGKWKASESVYNAILEKEKLNITDQQNAIDKALNQQKEALKEFGLDFNASEYGTYKQFKEAQLADKESIEGYEKVNTILERNWDNYITAWTENNNLTFYEYLENYAQEQLTALQKDAKELSDYFDYITNRRAAIDKAETGNLDALKRKNKIESQKILSQNYSALTEGQLEAINQDLGIDLNQWAKDNKDGTFDVSSFIDSDTFENNLPIETQNAILSSIESEFNAASEAMSNLGSAAAGKADPGVYAKAFDKTGLSYKYLETHVPRWIQGSLEEKKFSIYAYKSLIRQQLEDDEFEGDIEAEVDRIYNESIKKYIDTTKSNTLTALDAMGKALDGTLGEQELLELQDLEFSADIDISWITTNLEENGTEYINNYWAAISEAINKIPEEQWESYFDDAAERSFKQAFKEKESSKLNKEVSEASGEFSEELITDVARQAKKILDPNILSELFNYEVATDTYSAKLNNKTREQWITEVAQLGFSEEALRKSFKGQDYNKIIKTDTIQESLNNLLTALSEITLDSIKSLYDEIYGEGAFTSDQNFDLINTWIDQAKEGSYNNIISYIQSLYEAAINQGYDIDTSEIETLIQQFYESIIETLSSALSAGIEGSLDTTTFNDLAKKYGISGTKTATGYSLGSSAQRTLVSEMYKAAELSGSTIGFGEQLWKTWSESANAPLKSYAAISDELDKAINKTGDLVDVTDEYVKALEQARAAAYLDPNAYEFSFMDQDATSGLTQNFDNFVGQIETVKSTLETLKGSGAVGYQEFYNLIDFIDKSGQWDSVSEKLGKAGVSAREFANTIVEASGEIGKVDAKGFAEISVDMTAAANAFGEGMEKGLRTVADDQIKYLTGLENMLLAMQALSGLNVEAGIEFDIVYNENGQNITFTSFEEILDHYQQLPKEKKSEFLVNIKQSIENLPGNAGELVKIFGGDEDISEEDLIIMSKIESAWDGAAKETREKIIASLQDLTQEQGQWLAEYFASGETTDIDISKLFNFLIDPETIGQSFGSQLQNAFSENYQFNIANVPISVVLDSLDGTDFKLNGDLKNLGPGRIELEKQLNEQLAKEGLEINEIDYETGLVTVKKLNIPIDEIQEVAVKEENKNGEVSYKVPISGDIELVWEKETSFTLENVEGLSSEEIQKQIAEYFHVALESVQLTEIEGEVGQFNVDIDFSTQKDSLTLIQEDLAAIREAFETGIKIIVDNQEAISAIDAVKSAIDDLPDTHTIFITTIKKTIDNTRKRPNSYVAQGLDGEGQWTGNMNNITGSALADGNVTDKLLAGANLANKTLVGELGPELAVYNGKYHMLGANGAEFVKLPSDAIVFNHLQTAGILKGQMNVRGQALAEGNVSGPALAGGGIDSALAAVRRAKAVWQGLLDNLTAAELAGAAGGGGGGGGGAKNHSEELQEWYNLSRQISNIEQEINNILAERKNITEGDSYLRSLREQQKLLREQANIQEVLLGYQQLQLKRQADTINNDKLWSRFLEVDENGLLQYTKGNELNGGKGALQVLQEMNEMSGEDQIKFLKEIGYTYTTADGEELKEGELVQKFYEELQKQIDDYDALYDTVHETKETLEGIDTSISEIDEEIKQNQMDLEQAIFDIIVEAWEKQIEQMEEYNDLVKEANDRYIDGLNDALEKEKELYSQNETIAEREQLQRRLSLLRRSGGSASEIASLEEQLDDKLKDEYFRNQEEAIKNIQEANDRQVELLEQQVKLQQDSLEHQKEHGVIWSQVYDIMSGSAEQILAFMQGNKPEFFTQSLLQQEEMLTDWAMKIGIYTEDRQYQNHEAYARGSIWDNGNIFNNDKLKSLQGAFNNLTPERQQQLQEYFSSVYATSRIGGADEATATQEAINALAGKMGDHSEQQGLASGSSGGKEEQESNSGSDNKKPESKYKFTYNGKNFSGFSNETSAKNKIGWLAQNYIDKALKDAGIPKGGPIDGRVSTYGSYGSFSAALAAYNGIIRTANTHKGLAIGTIKPYSQGGLVDYTGLAMVHGSKSKPESFLNAEQTAQIREALEISGNRNMLEDVRSSLQALQSTIKSITNIANNSETSSITIAPGAVVIEVAELADSYDVDTLSADVMNRIVNIANKRTTRSVNRR